MYNVMYMHDNKIETIIMIEVIEEILTKDFHCIQNLAHLIIIISLTFRLYMYTMLCNRATADITKVLIDHS